MQASIWLISFLSVCLAILLGVWKSLGLILWFLFIGLCLFFLVSVITRSLYYCRTSVLYYLVLSFLSHLVWLDFQLAGGSALSGSDDSFFYGNSACIGSGGPFCRHDAFSYFLTPLIMLMDSVDDKTNIGVYAITSALTALNFVLCKALAARCYGVRVPGWLLFSTYFAVAQLFINSMMLYREALVLLLMYGALHLYEGVSRLKSGLMSLSILGVAYLRIGSAIIVPAYLISRFIGISSFRRAALFSIAYMLVLTLAIYSLAPVIAAYGSSATNLSRYAVFSEASGEDILNQRMQKRVEGSIGDGRAESLKTSAFSSVTPANVALRFLIPTAYPISFREFSIDMSARDILANISIILKPIILPLIILGLLIMLRHPFGAPLLFALFSYALLVLLISGMARHLMPLYWIMPIAAAFALDRLRKESVFLGVYLTLFSLVALTLVVLNG